MHVWIYINICELHVWTRQVFTTISLVLLKSSPRTATWWKEWLLLTHLQRCSHIWRYMVGCKSTSVSSDNIKSDQIYNKRLLHAILCAKLYIRSDITPIYISTRYANLIFFHIDHCNSQMTRLLCIEKQFSTLLKQLTIADVRKSGNTAVRLGSFINTLSAFSGRGPGSFHLNWWCCEVLNVIALRDNILICRHVWCVRSWSFIVVGTSAGSSSVSDLVRRFFIFYSSQAASAELSGSDVFEAQAPYLLAAILPNSRTPKQLKDLALKNALTEARFGYNHNLGKPYMKSPQETIRCVSSFVEYCGNHF